MIRFLAPLASALALAACTTVGPTYRSPEAQAPAQAPFAGASSPVFSGDQPSGAWWSLFADPVLDGLVRDALANNTDLRVAAANLTRARAALRERRGDRSPAGSIGASASTGRQSAMGQPGGATSGEIFDVGLDVGYQVDLVGGIRRGIEASRADVGAVQAAFDLARVTVAAEAVRAYADACSAGNQLAVATRSVAVQQRTFDLTRRLLEGGRGTALETGQAAQLLEQTRAQIPTIEADRRTALYQLSVLTGRPPAEFPQVVAACSTSPALTRRIPIGDGTSLLRRRPDIRASERRLAAATARIGVATAELYPNVSLGGSLGSTAATIGGLVTGGALRYSVGPLITWAFLNRGAVRARIAQAEATTEAALAEFDGTWLGALEETESALTRYSSQRTRVETLRRARDGGAQAARIARLRYEAGREGFQIVLEAERRLAEVQGELAQAEGQLSDNLVSLFLALGGGWEDANQPSPRAG
ncbi:MAG TPA: efflux transporter outer membrane subunit [Allosphingosinicella sp.]|jgi:NodT family efflux transporter outer membrane factor (OMF) lipoprotein|uniref:efflux transporter outer membrane subunit n=1 Tax=Allosphingosinicella sp. TaxID=2823234 RepID=UPI002F270576